jgi:hypothetical protein
VRLGATESFFGFDVSEEGVITTGDAVAGLLVSFTCLPEVSFPDEEGVITTGLVVGFTVVSFS